MREMADFCISEPKKIKFHFIHLSFLSFAPGTIPEETVEDVKGRFDKFFLFHCCCFFHSKSARLAWLP